LIISVNQKRKQKVYTSKQQKVATKASAVPLLNTPSSPPLPFSPPTHPFCFFYKINYINTAEAEAAHTQICSFYFS
jgi:hypothetical protein